MKTDVSNVEWNPKQQPMHFGTVPRWMKFGTALQVFKPEVNLALQTSLN